MRIGVVGLGLIGGSVAKAIKKYTGFEVLGYDTNKEVAEKALAQGAIDGQIDEGLSDCDIIVLGLYPEAAVEYIQKNKEKIRRDAVVTDVGGVKRTVCDGIYPIAKEFGFTFIGMHPMAGIEKSGFDNSDADMFIGASLVVTPFDGTPKEKLDLLIDTFMKLGFGKIRLSNPAEHDRIIAYTSQLAHVVSSCYIKSPTSMLQSGFSAGSFKDMTRVARLNETMWTELFLENSENLAKEIRIILKNLEDYADAIENRDREKLFELLKDGREKKEKSEKNQ